MKDIFDYILKTLPQPLVLACVAVGVVYFAIYYHYSYQSYGDAFRDNKFRTAAILIFAAAIVYSLNKRPSAPVDTASQAVLVVPLFQNDADDKCRAPFVATIESRLDATLGRSGTVQRVRFFVADEKSARSTMDNYGATAILYDASVSEVGEDQVVCFKVLTAGTGSLARLPPVSLSDPFQHIDRLVIDIAGELAATDSVASQNPLISRLADVERRLDQLASLVEASQTRPTQGKEYPRYKNRYAVLIGIDKFDGSPTELRFAKSDAIQFDALLTDSYGFNTTVLHDTNATKAAIKNAIGDFAGKCGPDDVFVFYFGGNVTEIKSTDSTSGRVASLVAYDFKSNPFSTLELLEEINKLPAKHKLVLVDGCHATSGLAASATSVNTDADPADSVLQFFGACRADQFSMEDSKGGVFSQAIMRALTETATNSDGGIWMADLSSRVHTQVAANHRQTPELMRISGNGSIAWVPQQTADSKEDVR